MFTSQSMCVCVCFAHIDIKLFKYLIYFYVRKWLVLCLEEIQYT